MEETKMDVVQKKSIEDIEKDFASALKYEKLNNLIMSRFNMNRQEQDIFNYSLSKIKGKRFTDEQMQRGISVSMDIKEIRTHILNSRNGDDGNTEGKVSVSNSIYTNLKKISNNFQSQKIFIEAKDENGKNRFIMFPLVKTCTYENGVFTMVYHEAASEFIVNRNEKGKPFTICDYDTMKSLSSGYAKRIYELLEKEKFRMKNGQFVVEYPLLILKMMLGLIDNENEKVKVIQKKYADDLDKMEEEIDKLDADLNITDKKRKMQVHKLKKWGNFRDRVLKVAQEQMRESAILGISDLIFDYEPIPSKRSKKVSAIRFTVYDSTLYNIVKDKEPKQMTLFDVEAVEVSYTYEDVINIIEEKGVKKFFAEYNKYTYKVPEEITDSVKSDFNILIMEVVNELFKDILKRSILSITARNIAEACEYDLKRFFCNVEYTLMNKSKVIDVQSYLVDACRRDYTNTQVPVVIQRKNETIKERLKRTNTFHFSCGREYSKDEMVEMEKFFLERSLKKEN